MHRYNRLLLIGQFITGLALISSCLILIAKGANPYPLLIVLCVGSALIVMPFLLSLRNKFSFKLGKVEVNSIADRIAERMENPIEDGKTMLNHYAAFKLVEEKIDSILTQQTSAEIDLRFLAVSLRYSYQFINDNLFDIIAKHKGLNVTFRIDIAICDSEYLHALDIDTHEFDWSACSRDVEEKLMTKTVEKFRSLNSSSIKIYFSKHKNLPQYHGLLINGKELFLGSTNWKKLSNIFVLTVGSNEYTYYNSHTQTGSAKIDNFRHWFDYYTTQRTVIL